MNIEFNKSELDFLKELIFNKIDKVGGFEGLTGLEQMVLMKILNVDLQD